MRKILTYLVLLLLPVTIFAQGSEDELISTANQLFEQGSYAKAMPYYSQLLALHPVDPIYNYKYGASSLYGDASQKEDAVKYLRFAASKSNVPPDVFFFLGRAYHLNYQFADAIKAYKKYEEVGDKRKIEDRQVDLLIQMAQNGKGLLNNIKQITVLDKQETTVDQFFRLYDLSDIGGKILVTPEELLTKEDEKKGHRSLIHYPGNGSTTIYFSSYGKDGKTGLDIYRVRVLPGGKFTEPEKIPGDVNTPYDEDYPFMHPDGKTLYFSSQGHTSMGGYDIFKSEYRGGHWTTPVDLGYPINTPDADVFFVLGASGRRGYYSSIKKDGFGEKDIYVITFLGPEKPAVLNNEDNLIASDANPIKEHVIEQPITITTKKITLLKGTVKEFGSLKPVKAQIELIDLEDNTTLATFTSNATTGKYLVSLPSGKNYGLNVRAPGYLFYSDHFNLPDSAAYQEIHKNILLQKLKVGSKVVLKNIFYDYNKATLRKESTSELDRVVKLLQDNPTLKVELAAYTDQRGSNSYNQTLSGKRAQSCVDYLIKKGIAKNRLVAKGYGEADPINSMAKINKAKTQEEKELLYQQNRRTEIKVIAK